MTFDYAVYGGMMGRRPHTREVPVAKGKHIGFRKLRAQLAAKGARNPGGLAYKIGVKKYGKAGMAAKAAAGRRRAARKRSR